MNIQQLRALCEVVRRDFKVSAAAEALCRAQPVISRQIREIEEQLDTPLFHRSKNRLTGLTPAGRDIHAVAERVLRDLDSLQSIAQEHTAPDQGDLTIATTQTHARYSLPDVIARFSARFPKVRLSLRQSNPVAACERVLAGEADLAICTQPAAEIDDILALPIYRVPWDVVVCVDHPLLQEQPVTLDAVARYPIITHDATFSGQRILEEALSTTGRSPFIFLEGVDGEVSKPYVERGLAVGILAKITFDPVKDRKLRLLELDHLFRPSVLTVCLRRQTHLRSYVLSFIESYAPHVAPDLVRKALAGGRIDTRRMARTAPLLTR